MNYKAEFQKLEAKAETIYNETNNFDYLNVIMCAYDNARDTYETENHDDFWRLAYGSIADSAAGQCVNIHWFERNGYK
jgi:hypothetical protein